MENQIIDKIFFNLEKISKEEIKLESDLNFDYENYEYIHGIASSENINSYGYIVDNKAVLESWETYKSSGKNIAVYEKHGLAVGKVILCQEIDNKIMITLEIPKAGNERLISVVNQGVYMGLSIGGSKLSTNRDANGVEHVDKIDWCEVSLTDLPSNKEALLLEEKYISKKMESNNINLEEKIESFWGEVTENIRGIE